jgi:hypothetical protein
MINFITGSKAYCLFPYNTLVKKEGYLLRDDDSYALNGAKWSAKLYALSKEENIRTKGLHWDDDESDLRLTSLRRFGDKYTLIISFDKLNMATDQCTQA